MARTCLIPLGGFWLVCLGVGWIAQSIQGRLFLTGLGLIALVLYALVAWGGPWRYRLWRRWGWRVGLCAGWIALVVSLLPVPKAEMEDPAIMLLHLHPGDAKARRALPMPFPEMDQIRLAAFLGEGYARLRGRTTEGRMHRLFSVFEASDTAFSGDPLLAESGSAVGGAWQELLTGSVRQQGYYLFLPKTPAGDNMPVLLFLHGFGGNLQAYRSAFVRLARHHGIAVLLPTLGMGRYREPVDGMVMACLEDALARYPLDPDRVFLGGMSMGGRGVTQILGATDQRFAGILLVSAVLDEDGIRETVSAGRWIGMPVHVIHGANDEAVPHERTLAMLEPVRQGGGVVHADPWEGGDHLLLFAEAPAVMDRVATWMQGVAQTPGQRTAAGEILFVQDRSVVIAVERGGMVGEGEEYGVLRGNRFVGRIQVREVAADTADADALPGPWDVRPGDRIVRMR